MTQYQSNQITEDLRNFTLKETNKNYAHQEHAASKPLGVMKDPLLAHSPEPSAILILGIVLIVTGLIRKLIAGR